MRNVHGTMQCLYPGCRQRADVDSIYCRDCLEEQSALILYARRERDDPSVRRAVRFVLAVALLIVAWLLAGDVARWLVR